MGRDSRVRVRHPRPTVRPVMQHKDVVLADLSVFPCVRDLGGLSSKVLQEAVLPQTCSKFFRVFWVSMLTSLSRQSVKRLHDEVLAALSVFPCVAPKGNLLPHGQLPQQCMISSQLWAVIMIWTLVFGAAKTWEAGGAHPCSLHSENLGLAALSRDAGMVWQQI